MVHRCFSPLPILPVLLGMLLLPASGPGTAQASTGTCDGSGTFSVTAAPGEVNRFFLTRPMAWEITDFPPGQLTGDSTCPGEVVAIHAGDLDDYARVIPAGGQVSVDGGSRAR